VNTVQNCENTHFYLNKKVITEIYKLWIYIRSIEQEYSCFDQNEYKNTFFIHKEKIINVHEEK